MRVLFYLEPFLDMGHPYAMESWLLRFHRMHEQLKVFADGYDGRLLTWEAYDYRLQGYFMDERIVLTQAELRLGWQAKGAMFSRLEWGTAPAEEVAALRALFAGKVAGFAPDVVILLTAADWLKPVFPDALFLHAEATWLYAPPHFDLWQLDPVGFGKGRALADHRAQWLAEQEWSEDTQRFCDRLKHVAQALWPAEAAIKERVAELRDRFRQLVLVPLGDHAPSDGETPTMCILDWYLERSDRETAFLVTYHPNAPALHKGHEDYLTSKYPNLIVDPGMRTHALLPLVDAVLGDFTSVSSQALLFDKPVIALGDDCPFVSPRFSVRSPLCRWLAESSSEERDRILHWLLTRYSIPQENLTNGLWLRDFLQRALDAFRAGTPWRVFDRPMVSQAEWVSRPWFSEAERCDEPAPDAAQLAAEALKSEHRKRYVEAESALEAGDREAAISMLHELVTAGTPLWEPFNDLAALAAGEGDWGGAEAMLKAALQTDPGARQARLNLVEVLKAQGKFEPALAELSPLLRKEPGTPEVLNLARDIVGLAPPLSTLAWIRLIADIRAPGIAARADQQGRAA